MACTLKEAHDLDAVYFVPTNINPLKKRELEHKKHRLRMLDLALYRTGFAIKTTELDRPPPSYMIDTVKQYMAEVPAQYFLLLGSDLLHDITQWKSYQELFALTPPLIAMRSNEQIRSGAWEHDPVLRGIIEKGITEAPCFDISSTYIRDRISRGLFCGHLLDKEVYTYILQHRLYGCP